MSLEVKIKKRFKGFTLDIEFTNQQNSMGILGASGSGKSMCLKCIAGIEKPDEGKIVLNGRVLFDAKEKINISPQKRNIGYLFQNYALFPKMTVEENIKCAIPQSNKTKILEIVQEKCSQFHIEELRSRYPSQLSGGQQQRVALARMFASEPELILLDEPFSALDNYLKEVLQQQLLETIHQAHKETIVVSHNRDELYKLCTDLAIVSEGRIIAKGNTKKVFMKPENAESARLLGCENISKITKINDYQMLANDWNVYLSTNTPIHSEVRYIGVWANDILTNDKKEGCNIVEVECNSIAEGPYEVQYFFKNKLSCKIVKNKEKMPDQINTIEIPPEKLILLK